ncbi:alpha/beta fold hydrolase [Nocardia grenadensis]|uniref:alpha/beta fold hydrolase n=1 Tax=Nocardia grenadensis TaxID=931537 RepID=UPI0009FF85E1|nr:alpha/beta fold hydrolase [Nocardia grenadensis]
MVSVYVNAPSGEVIELWCTERLQNWDVAHRQWSITTSAGPTRIVALGEEHDRGATVVLIPGTNMNTAVALPFLAQLAARYRVLALDVPGQPGLSAPERPRRDRMAWYGRWLGEVLEQTVPETAVLLGHSLGGAIALACPSRRVAGRVLIAPAGLARLAVPPRLLAATVSWLAAPSRDHTIRLLQLMTGPTRGVAPHLVDWMPLVARYCRTTLAPAPLAPRYSTAAARHPAWWPPTPMTSSYRPVISNAPSMTGSEPICAYCRTADTWPSATIRPES